MQRNLTNLLFLFSLSIATWSVHAADNSVIVGAWIMSIDAGGQFFDLDLNIEEGNEGLTGTMGAAEFGMSPLSNISFDGQTLKFETPDQQGGTVAVELKLAEGKLTGMLASPMGEIPATATKQ